MFGEIRKTQERRPTPIVKIAASINAAGARRGFRRLARRSIPAIRAGYTVRERPLSGDGGGASVRERVTLGDGEAAVGVEELGIAVGVEVAAEEEELAEDE